MKNKKTIKTQLNTTAPKSKDARIPLFASWPKLLNYFITLIVISFCFYQLAVVNYNVLFKIQELSLFLPGKYFLLENLCLPAGLLTYCSTFLIQFFYYPWLGASIFIALAFGAQFVFIRLFHIKSSYYLMTLVIPISLLLSVTQLGYIIYPAKLQYFVYSLTVGLLATLMLVWLYSSFKKYWLRALILIVVVLIMYPLIGFYAIFTASICLLMELIQYVKYKTYWSLFIIVLGLVLTIVYPYLLFQTFYTQTELAHIYSIGLPQLYETEYFCWIPYLAIALFLLLTLGLFAGNKFQSNPKTQYFISGLLFFISVFGVVLLSFDDKNFQAELAMEHAINENHWHNVLEIAQNQTDEPTRLMVLYTRLALQKLNKGGDDLFYYPNGNKEMNAPWPIQLLAVGGKQLYYHYGKLNYSYQAAFDDMVERGMKVEDLKFMVKCALLNKEYHLAQKYNEVLSKTFFYKSWAVEYQRYIQQPALIPNNDEFNQILKLSDYQNELFDASAVENYILQDFARNTMLNSDLGLNISMQSALILRNSTLFWNTFSRYFKAGLNIPKHYQEAAILFSFYEGSPDISKLPLDTNIVASFHEFEQFLNQNRMNTKEMNKNLLQPTFGHTFWFYFFFSDPIVSQ